MARAIDWHRHLITIAPVRPTDYADYGGEVERWKEDGRTYPDCSLGCYWWRPLQELPADWGVCSRPGAARCGLVTFEHQAGAAGGPDDGPCFESAQDRKRRRKEAR